MRQTRFKSANLRRVLANAALITGGVAAALWLLFGSSGGPPAEEDSRIATAVEEPSATVQLSANKLATAAIAMHEVSVRKLEHVHTVPGRIEYDATRRLELRVPAEGVIKSVLVRRGQHVQAGTQLAVFSSSQIGMARDQEKQRAEDVDLAKYQQHWTEKVVTNVQDLLASLAQSPTIAELEKAFKERPLGEHRQELFAAYSDLVLAKQVDAQSNLLGGSGVLSGRTLQERRNKLERARALFQSAIEQTEHHARVEKRTADVAVARAERAWKISSEQLAALLGPYAAQPMTTEGSLNEFSLSAPFAGTIDDLQIRPSAVVTANSSLLTIANTDYLWVSAQIHERNWRAASLGAGQTVRVRTPATGDREFKATVEFVGAVVDAETRALPLVAKIENRDGLFKPGMFVWVSLPVEEDRQAVAVPPGAVMRHEGEAFVFVADASDSFRRVDITTGLETKDWVEIRAGLVGGETIAATGTFVLKSELLLESEES